MHPLIPWWEPLAIPIGPLTVHGFGILVALGFVIGAQISMNKARRDGLEPDQVNRIVGWIVLGVFVGGHLGHLFFYYPEEVLEDPMVIFKVWEGLSSFGGFIAVTVLVVWFFWNENRRRGRENVARQQKGEPLLKRVGFFTYGDTLIYGFTMGWFFGRMGCFSAHDHPGGETNFWLGVQGMCPTHPADLHYACHDLGLYEALWSLALFGVFWVLDKKPRFPGYFIGLWCLAYGPFRLVLDIFRHPATDTRYFGMTPAQFGSILLTGVGIWLLGRRRHLPSIRPVATAGRADDEPAAGS